MSRDRGGLLVSLEAAPDQKSAQRLPHEMHGMEHHRSLSCPRLHESYAGCLLSEDCGVELPLQLHAAQLVWSGIHGPDPRGANRVSLNASGQVMFERWQGQIGVSPAGHCWDPSTPRKRTSATFWGDSAGHVGRIPAKRIPHRYAFAILPSAHFHLKNLVLDAWPGKFCKERMGFFLLALSC